MKNKQNPISIYEYYYNNVLNKLSNCTLEYQLNELKNSNIVVLDYSGMISTYAELFLKCNSKIYVIEDESEDIKSVIKNTDVIYVFSFAHQVIKTDYSHIHVIFRENSIINIAFKDST